MSNAAPEATLRELAHRAMVARGLEPDFPAAALAEAHALAPAAVAGLRDERDRLWCSIDNDDSRDLDQLTVAAPLADNATEVLVAIADVGTLVRRDSALDAHARANTTSVYTVAQVFPMLPERLSTDLTSLNFAVDRAAFVISLHVDLAGVVQQSAVYRALVRNRAKLAYDAVSAWLAGRTAVPAAIAAVPGLEANLRLQVDAARRLNACRHLRGALNFGQGQTRPVFVNGALQEIVELRNPVKDMIEDFMIAANSATAQFLTAQRFPSIRRVVRTPKEWERIVELAQQHGDSLPAAPDSAALAQFLERAARAHPDTFPELSLSVLKLLGKGEYVVEDGTGAPGHFGLAVRDYAHSTAPNRRYPDLLTQRLLSAALAHQPPPYGVDELATLATHCTAREDAAKKVERQIVKSAAAILLQPRLGEVFAALVTGVTERGTFVRLRQPPVEGKLMRGANHLRVGDRLRVRLLSTDVERGLIDFETV